jgi:hypothetical protein
MYTYVYMYKSLLLELKLFDDIGLVGFLNAGKLIIYKHMYKQYTYKYLYLYIYVYKCINVCIHMCICISLYY